MLVQIISKMRRAFGLSKLSDEDLGKTGDSWTELLMPKVPIERLEDCYLRVMYGRDGNKRFPLQPQELIRAWDGIRGELKEIAQSSPGPVMIDGEWVYKCLYCFDSGYQMVSYTRGAWKGYKAARGCVCEACPSAQRSLNPLDPQRFKLDSIRQEWIEI